MGNGTDTDLNRTSPGDYGSRNDDTNSYDVKDNLNVRADNSSSIHPKTRQMSFLLFRPDCL